MVEEEFYHLKDSIAKIGLLEPIWVDKDGLILDGRARYRACLELGIDPQYRTYEGDASILLFVVAANVNRRHLNPLQRAIIADKIVPMLSREAKVRMLKGKGDDGSGGRGRCRINPPEKIPEGLARPKETPAERESRRKAAKMVGVNPHYVSDVRSIASASDVIEAAMAGKITTMPDALKIAKLPEAERRNIFKKIDSGMKLSAAINENVNEAYRAKVIEIKAIEAQEIRGVYGTIVMDPPWNVKWRTPYPKMSVDEIIGVKPPCADDSHVFLWTIQEFLPYAFEVIKAWGLEYVCTFVWKKNRGQKPERFPTYNCEFVLYCRKGRPRFVDTKKFKVCFEALAKAHSEKPEEFYETLRRVTDGRRLDMYNRRPIEGFDVWGNEVKQAA
jgi:N6-adenosine-specific RNA methylase IME4/ParB-like chromosome segregation protein Spo0J